MPEAEIPQALRACAYHVVRYTPNLVRDEWVNIGILLFDPASGRLLQRVVEEPSEFARVRRLQPTADQELLRRLSDDFASQSAAAGGNAQAYIARLEQTLSTTVQLSPQKGLLAEDLEAELDRLYRDHVEAPRQGRLTKRSLRATESARGPIRFSAGQASGRDWNAGSALMNLLTRATRCESIMATGATARGDSCRHYRCHAIQARQRYWSLPQTPSGKKSHVRNLSLSPKASRIQRKIPAIVLSLGCSRHAKSA
jgi:hypothetical protein